jgi:hypothetical protein
VNKKNLAKDTHPRTGRREDAATPLLTVLTLEEAFGSVKPIRLDFEQAARRARDEQAEKILRQMIKRKIVRLLSLTE